jgi:hypothetical protein
MHVNVREGNTLEYPLLEESRWTDLPEGFGGTGREL